MKIAYISNSSAPSHLPSSLQIVKTCETLSKMKNHVHLIIPNTSKFKDTFQNFYNIKNNFKITKIKKYKKFPIGINYYTYSINTFLKVCFSYDIVISRNFFVIFLCCLINKNCIIELHHDIKTESRIINFIYNKINIFNKNCLKIIAITKGVKEFYDKKFKLKKNKIIVVPSGSSLNLKFKNSLNIKKLKIGYFGSINYTKGIGIIQKLARMDNYNNYYIFGGTNNQVSELKYKNNSKNLKIHSHQNYKKLPKLLMSMDVLLMPYLGNITAAGNVSDITNFTSPLKLFDYMESGKIIVSSEIKVLKEILKDKKNCIFIKNYNSPTSWFNEIKKIKNNIMMRNIIAKNSKKLAENFNHENRIKYYLQGFK